jgi:hypothetical protein
VKAACAAEPEIASQKVRVCCSNCGKLIACLVNNAGVGYRKDFAALSLGGTFIARSTRSWMLTGPGEAEGRRGEDEALVGHGGDPAFGAGRSQNTAKSTVPAALVSGERHQCLYR